MNTDRTHLRFTWEYDDEEHQRSFFSSHVPRKGERVTFVPRDQSTLVMGDVSFVEWSFVYRSLGSDRGPEVHIILDPVVVRENPTP